MVELRERPNHQQTHWNMEHRLERTRMRCAISTHSTAIVDIRDHPRLDPIQITIPPRPRLRTSARREVIIHKHP